MSGLRCLGCHDRTESLTLGRSPLTSNQASVSVVAPVSLVVSVIAWMTAAILGVPVPVAAAGAVLLGLVLGVVLYLRSPRSVLKALRAKPIAAGDNPRLENLVDGLCTTHAFARPSLHVVESPAVNAAAVGLNQVTAHLVVTSGALSRHGRLELEAVVARQLCVIRSGVAFPTVVASVCGLLGLAQLAARLAARVSDFNAVSAADIEAARLTSYPPAMSVALQQSADGGPLDTPRSVVHLWMTDPLQRSPAAAGVPSTLQRIDVLDEI